MKKTSLLLALLATAALAQAKLPDWTAFELGEELGVYGDKRSTLELAQVEGPAAGQQALQIKGEIAEYAGVWAQAPLDLGKAKGLRFQVKSSKPGLLMVSFMDELRLQKNASVRLSGKGWQNFEIPLALFKPSTWMDPEAPKNKAFDPAKVVSVTLSPMDLGAVDLRVGPMALVKGESKAKTGRPELGAGKLMVQDFELLGANGMGSFADEKGSRLDLKLKEGVSGQVLAVDYERKDAGWCGLWARVGEDWQGQDWRGAKALSLKVKSSEPLNLDLAFNDANQNAYVVRLPRTKGKGWETLRVDFSAFELNADYQPPQAKKGAPMDVSRVEAFNLAPKSGGEHVFELDDLILEK